MAINCWEYKKCGREENGIKSKELGACPAATSYKMDGIHGGKRGGRCCWVIIRTLCCDKKQESFALKLGICEQCDFYKLVQTQEGLQFKSIIELLHILY